MITFLIVFFQYFLQISQASLEKPKPPVVFVEIAKSTDLFDLLTYPARLVPKVNATVLSDSEGIITKIDTPLGTPVQKQQRILTLKHTDPVYDYAPISVTAPVAGVVSSVEVTEGSRVTKGQKLVTITDPKKIKIVVEIASTDISAILVGLTGELKIAGYEDAIPVKVTGISPFVDPASGTATTELSLEDTKKPMALPPGLVGRVAFRVREHKGFQIPDHAIVYKGKDSFVRTVENGKAKLSPVTLGQSRRGFVEILKGLSAGTTIITRTNSYIADGEEVSVQNGGAAVN